MREAEERTRNLLGRIAGDRSRQLVEGALDTILGAFDVALSLGLLVLDIAFGLSLLSGRLPRLETGQVADRLFDLSDCVLDGARRLAINETKVSTGSRGKGGRFRRG